MVAAVTGFPARCRCRPHGGPAPSRRYERRRPEKTPLHKIVSENLESWLAWREAVERSVPAYVEDELRGYLECGMLCFGFARAVCMTCRTGFVVAFSCKGRGVEQPLHAEPPDHATADPLGERGQIGLGNRPGRQERRRGVAPCIGGSRHEDAVGHAGVEVDMVIERRTEAVQEGDGTESRAGGSRHVGIRGPA